MPAIKRIYVRRYSDNGQVKAYVDWADGTHIEGTAQYGRHHRGPHTPSFGSHMHALFARAKREGLRLERESW